MPKAWLLSYTRRQIKSTNEIGDAYAVREMSQQRHQYLLKVLAAQGSRRPQHLLQGPCRRLQQLLEGLEGSMLAGVLPHALTAVGTV